MSLYGPAIPAALLDQEDGAPQVVHPAADRWWHNLKELRLASQAGRLSCPDCGQRLVFVCEKVPTPYFRHYRDTEDCVAESSAVRYERRVQGWMRHQLVVAFRSVLPPGTSLSCDEYLANRRPTMAVQVPGRPPCTLEVVTEPQELAPFLQRQAEGPWVPVFVGRRIPPAVLEAARGMADGQAAQVELAGLNADHVAAARPLRVDMAHAAAGQFYDLPLLAGEPGSLLFFQPGPRREDLSHLLLLRGLMPHPTETAWLGQVVKAPMVPGAVAFSTRHGFYTPADLAVLRQMRDLFRRRRRGRPPGARTDAAYVHPLRRAWQTKAALMEQGEAKRRAEEAAERERAEAIRREIAEHHAREAQRLQEAEAEVGRRRLADAQWRQRTRERLWHRLQQEGAVLLEGEAVRVPHPEAFAAAPLVWQGAFLAFASRAGLPFTQDQCLNWLRGQFAWVVAEPLLPRESWQATVSVRQFLADAVRRQLLEQNGNRLRPAELWLWPGEQPTGTPPAICLLCGAVVNYYDAYDPDTGFCRCTGH
jgi:hypothetical protein